MTEFLIENGRRISFWKDIWGGKEALSAAFPVLFDFAVQKEAMVAEVWDNSRVDRWLNPSFSRPFNDWEVERFLQVLQNKKIKPSQDDKLLLKEAKEGAFSVKLMYKVLDQSPTNVFPYQSIWNPYVPNRVGFLCVGSF